MQKTDNIDFLYLLHEHKWSTFCLFVNDRSYSFRMTHIFGNPLAAYVQLLTGLAAGETEVKMVWYDEPGGTVWRLFRKKGDDTEIKVTINTFDTGYCDSIDLFYK